MVIAAGGLAPARPHPRLTGAGAARLAERDERIVVVGAGGWVGLASLELLHALLGETFARRVVCFGSAARSLSLRGGVTIEQQPLGALRGLAERPSLVLHLAFLTQEKAKTMVEDDYVAANRAISATIVESLDAIGATGLFLASSGAVHAVDDPRAERSKRLYGSLKLEDEERFSEWAAGRGAGLAIARVFNLSGPYINKQSSYALAAFIADALAGRPIRIAARRPVYRSYVAIAELIDVVLGILTGAVEAATSFDTAGEAVYEMGEIARIIDKVLGRELGVARPPMQDGEVDRYVGDGAVLARLRRHIGATSIGFADQVRDTAAWMAGVAGEPAAGRSAAEGARNGTE